MDAVSRLCKHYGEEDPKRLISRLCRGLLAQAPIEIPTPIRELAKVRRIHRVDREAMGPGSRWWELSQQQHAGPGWAAAVVNWRDGYRVILERTDPPEKQRFSLSHEIVHTFFLDLAVNTDQPSPQLEALCDQGAAELLMPASHFRRMLNSQPLVLRQIERCSRSFEVSLQAGARRAMQLAQEKAAVLIVEWSPPGQPQDVSKRPTVTVVYNSRTWPIARRLVNLELDARSVAGLALRRSQRKTGIEALQFGSSPQRCSVDVIGYRFRGGRLDGHARAVALVKPNADPPRRN